MALTPRSRFKYQQALAQQMGQDAASTAPVQHWTQGLARMLQGGLSGYLMNKGMQGEAELDQARRDTLAKALGAGDPNAALGILAQNPETADMGAQVGLERMFRVPEKQGPITVAPGASVYDPVSGETMFTAPARPEPPKTITTAEGVFVLNPDGTPGRRIGSAPIQPREPRRPDDFERWLEVNPGKNYNDFLVFQQDQAVARAEATAGSRPLTENEGKAGTFSLRMEGATETINNVMNGPDGKPGTADDYNPVNTQDILTGAIGADFMKTPEGKKFRQAQEDWVTANLRRESGAVIGTEEMEQEIDKYFPRFGDTPEVIAQKAQSRARAEAGMRAQAGRAYDEIKSQFGGNSQAVQIGPNGEGYDALPSGTRFIDPNGQLRIKP